MQRSNRSLRAHSGALVALVLVLTLISSACGPLLADDETADEPELVAAARATLTQREMLREPTPTPTARPAPATFTPTVAEAAVPCDADALIAGLPPGLPPVSPGNDFWYGSAEAGLWASPVNFGYFLSDEVNAAESLWFAGEVTPVLWYGSNEPVAVTATTTDGSVTVEQLEPRDALLEVQWTDILFPEPGCWELTGATTSSALTLTVRVLPISQRADFRLIQTTFDALPYEAPTTCPVTPLAGPDARAESENFAHYWLEAGGIAADVGTWFIAGEQQSMGVYGEGVTDGLSARMRGLDPGMDIEMAISTAFLNSEGRVASFIFPEPGCWELEFTTASAAATFTVYVYPYECRPTYTNGETLVSCEEP